MKQAFSAYTFALVATLLDIITYERVHYVDLVDEEEKDNIRKLALQLWPLQDEVNQHQLGEININRNGKIVPTGFPISLKEKILSMANPQNR